MKKDLSKFVIPAYEVLLFDSIIYFFKYWIVGDASNPLFLDLIKGILLYGGVLWNSPVWFLLTLFLCKYLFICCNHINKSIPYILALFCVGVCSAGFNENFPSWWLFNVIMSFPFFSVGVLTRNIKKGVFIKPWMHIPLVVLWIVLSLYNGYTDIHIQINGKNYLLFLITGITGSYLCIALSTAISKTCGYKLLDVIGQYSFVVLVTHYYICRWIIPSVFRNMGIRSNVAIQCAATFYIALFYYEVIKMCTKFKKVKSSAI